jgi:hypothetical protein
MKNYIFIATILSLVGVSYSESTWDQQVLVLDDRNFEDEIKKYDFLLIEFYAPWW